MGAGRWSGLRRAGKSRPKKGAQRDDAAGSDNRHIGGHGQTGHAAPATGLIASVPS